MEIISPIVGIIGEYSVRPIGKQFGYINSYNSNIAILEEKFPKLLEMKEAMQQSVDGAECNQEGASILVKTWQTNVGKKIEEVHKFLEEDVKSNRMCLNGWCPNLKLCYSLGKKAQKNTRAIDELLKEGDKYVRPYNKTPPFKVRSLSTELFKDFESRNSTIRNVLEALRNDKMDIIALCGMGGIGKTEMAKEIARRVKGTDNLFKEVAIATVSQSPDLRKIQGELAEMLGLRLDKESLHERANELYSRLTEAEKVLVILDDVWEQISHKDLEDIGVNYAVKENKCKILFTSRNEQTCIQMTNNIFRVGFLSEEEAWNLFKDMTNDCINTPNLIPIAQQVAKECAGLPLAIVVVGSALRNNRDEIEWEDVLQQLKMSIPENITGMDPKLYSIIEFSYNYLRSDEAKSCFLLCCLYPEDYDIPVEHLVRYGVAKRFLKGCGIVEKIRVHVNTIVRNLQRSNLLLDSQNDECVKMHDVVRDVAISIASREEHGVLVELDRRIEEWPQNDTYDSYTTISLLLGEMKGHPDGLKCPKLQLLRLSCLKDSETLPGNFFNGMNELKMLYLEEGCFSLKSLPSSIHMPKNLLMLNLESCRLGDVSAIGTLGKLEILSFRDSKIEELPHEIGNLSQVKLLDMKGCRSLKQIAAGVLSSLSRLQELYIANFKNWEYTTTMERNGEGTSNNASLVELIPLFDQMKVLEISVPRIGCLPKELHFRNSNLRFRINTEDDKSYLFENEITLDEREDASDLGRVLLENRGVFGNLKHCEIYNCQLSKNIFWLAMVRDLVQLKSLAISKCENIQEIFSKEGDQDKEKVVGGVITLPNLEKIRLENLPRLIGIFCKSMDSVEVEGGGGSTSSTTLSHKLFSSNTILWFPNLVELSVAYCKSLQVIFDLEGLKVIEKSQPVLALSQLTSLKLSYLHGMAHVWKNIPRGFQGFQNLVSIDIYECKNLRSLLPATVAKLLVQLQTVTLTNQDEPNVSETENQTKMSSLFPYYLIESLGNLEILSAWYCDSLEVIFELDEGLSDLEESNYIFNNLTELKLICSPKLLHIWKKGPRDIKGFNNLRLLDVEECHSLKCLFTPSIAKLLVKLEDIQVWSCSEMKEIIAKESGDEEKRDHVIAFPQVKTLRLVHLPKLECFCNDEAIAFEWPSLEKITIDQCEELKMFVPTTSMKTPKLQGVHYQRKDTLLCFQPMIEGDLNTTIQHIIKGKVRY
ncbi:hypothetical protein I3843_16G010700 [Carya illinoinensis]|nr:hypothetical protein I3843_16G010700 [Carya illinoinensis]